MPVEIPRLTCTFSILPPRRLAGEVYQVFLRPVQGPVPRFFAGQYLQLMIPGVEAAYFSIASAPGGGKIELHILALPDAGSAITVLNYLKEQKTVDACLPFGACYVSTVPDRAINLVAAGTGFAQAKSIMEWLLQQPGPLPPVRLYWGVRRACEIYQLPLLAGWRNLPGLEIHAICADNPSADWPGKHGELKDILLRESLDWKEQEVIASGSPAMVYSILDCLTGLGLPEEQFHSDVLEYAPR